MQRKSYHRMIGMVDKLRDFIFGGGKIAGQVASSHRHEETAAVCESSSGDVGEGHRVKVLQTRARST
jgi:rhamnose utilization protein RhaD (predicted bifunctional aldolase and dehydrogenase)